RAFDSICGNGMRAVDTNVLVRIVIRDDERQVAIADEYIANGAWVSHLVLAEAAWVLGSIYGLDDPEVAQAIEMLLNHRSLIIQSSDSVAAALELYRLRPGLGFTDCLILEIARSAGHSPLGTFDRALGRLPGAQKL